MSNAVPAARRSPRPVHVPPPVHMPREVGATGWRTAVAAAVRVFRDSERTEDIMIAEEITAQRQLAYLRDAGVMATGEGPDVMRDRPDFADMDLAALRAMAPGSLGAALAAFFDDNGLSTNLYSAPTDYTDDDELAYLMQRIRGSHDIWHVLSGLGIAGHDEILLHAFSLAQTGLPSSIALMVFGGLKHMVLEARWGCVRTGLRAAYNRGKNAVPLIPVYWERHFERPLAELRAELRIAPWTDEDRAATEPWRFRGPAVA